jgi:dGTPase
MRPFDRSRASEGGLKSFCSQLTYELVTEVTAGGSLRWHGNIDLQRRIAVLKGVNWVWMIEQPEHATRRFAQRRMLFDLFDGFLAAPDMLPYQDEWARVAERGETERARFVADHVASMTDTYAMQLHAEMYGGRQQHQP